MELAYLVVLVLALVGLTAGASFGLYKLLADPR